MSIYRAINPTMNRLLRSPWHRIMSKRVMTVSYKGRKSGKEYQTPISYYRDGDTVYCFTNGAWRHNFATEARASLRIAGQDYPVTGQFFNESHEQQVAIMSEYFKAVPQDRKFYGVRCEADGQPIRSQVESALQRIAIIAFTLQSP